MQYYFVCAIAGMLLVARYAGTKAKNSWGSLFSAATAQSLITLSKENKLLNDHFKLCDVDSSSSNKLKPLPSLRRVPAMTHATSYLVIGSCTYYF